MWGGTWRHQTYIIRIYPAILGRVCAPFHTSHTGLSWRCSRVQRHDNYWSNVSIIYQYSRMGHYAAVVWWVLLVADETEVRLIWCIYEWDWWWLSDIECQWNTGPDCVHCLQFHRWSSLFAVAEAGWTTSGRVVSLGNWYNIIQAKILCIFCHMLCGEFV